MRPLRFVPQWTEHPEGSCLVEMGRTRVLCTATLQEGVPGFLKGSGEGWVTAEYDMLPRATHQRRTRTFKSLHPDGRIVEIGRLIGRSLRAAVDREALGEWTWIVDCDVLQADGGTRTAAINGGMLALYIGMRTLTHRGVFSRFPIRTLVAAVSVARVDGTWVVDPDYEADAGAEVDLNVVMTETGQLVELQATAEHGLLPPEEVPQALNLAHAALQDILAQMRETLKNLA